MKKIVLVLATLPLTYSYSQQLSVTEKGRYTDSRDAACEISTYDKNSKKVFTTNAASDSIDILDVSTLSTPTKVGGINVLAYGGGVNSVVSLNNGYIAAAIQANVKQDSGIVAFFDTAGSFVASVKVGALPDMITVTPDGNKVLVANEGEPNDAYTIDPKGSIAIIDISGGVTSIKQSDVTLLFFDNAPSSINGSVRNPSTSYSVDLEPEYIAVSKNSNYAAVICQESNVFIMLDLVGDSIMNYKGLGFKDHSLAGNGLDASNKDNTINIKTWNVKGVYQPDAISSFTNGGKTYWISANEGDGRDYSGFSSEVRIKDLTLDSLSFPNRVELQNDTNLGRLKTFTANVIGDTDGDGDVDQLYSYGGRSFSIWDSAGNLIWDSGDEIEQYIALNHPGFFNCNDGKSSKSDSRSDDKGPEPEAVTTGVIGSKTYAFVGLERQGGIMIYDISNPINPIFDQYIQNFDTALGIMVDIAPEGLVFVPASESHTSTNLLITSNEVSGTTTIYEIKEKTNASINEISGTDFSIFPNPTHGKVTINTNSNKLFHYYIVNSIGQTVMNGSFNNKEEIELNQLSNGLFFITLLDENNIPLTKKIIKH